MVKCEVCDTVVTQAIACVWADPSEMKRYWVCGKECGEILTLANRRGHSIGSGAWRTIKDAFKEGLKVGAKRAYEGMAYEGMVKASVQQRAANFNPGAMLPIPPAGVIVHAQRSYSVQDDWQPPDWQTRPVPPTVILVFPHYMQRVGEDAVPARPPRFSVGAVDVWNELGAYIVRAPHGAPLPVDIGETAGANWGRIRHLERANVQPRYVPNGRVKPRGVEEVPGDMGESARRLQKRLAKRASSSEEIA